MAPFDLFYLRKLDLKNNEGHSMLQQQLVNKDYQFYIIQIKTS